MKREVWPFALLVVFALFMVAGPVTAQEAEPAEETEPAQEAEAVAEAAAAVEAEAAPEETGPEFKSTIKFSLLSQLDLDGAAGQISVRSVEFEVAGSKGGGITGTFSSGDADMNAVITTRLGCATTADTKQKFDIMVEFLDEDGDVIDRVFENQSLKNKAKVFNIKHTTLRWAVDHIVQVRISVKAKD